MPDGYYVYAHIKAGTSEIFYIGKGTGNRAYQKCGRSNRWKNYVNKYGLEVLFLRSNLSNEEASKYEIEKIGEIGRLDTGNGPLINMTDGGEGTSGKLHTAESKELMSERAKGRKLSEETKKKLSDANIGKKASSETKKKLSMMRSGKKMKSHVCSDEAKAKTSLALKGRTRSPETIQKIRETILAKRASKNNFS